MASLRCRVAPESESPFNLALQLVEQRLLSWAADRDAFAAVLRQAFGVDAGGATAEALRASLLGEGLEVGLVVQSLPGLRGAYAAASGSAPEWVLLDGDWLAVATADELEAVLLEELGHALDQRLNGAVDSPGDEGEIFSALLRGVALSADSASENDLRWVGIGGESRLVEAADTTAPRLLLNGSRNPSFAGSAIAFGLPDAGDSAHPSFADIDADGDLDVFIGKRDGRTVFFQNIGDATFPAFAGSVSAFGLTDVGVLSAPSFADIDADGDLDAFIGNQDGNTLFFRNTGTKSTPAFAGSSISFELPDVGTNASPSLADIDADGDLDAFIGNNSGNTLFFRNTGSKFSAAYAVSSIAFGLSNAVISAQPTFADIDADGDLDAFIGNNNGNIIFFRNSGTPTNPAFAGSSIGFGLPDVGFFASPSLVDIDADGDLDLFIGTDYGNTIIFSNDGNFAVSSATSNGSYGPSSIITIQLSFTEVVFVTGTPNVRLETGTTDRLATYSSGSGTNTLSFRYTVQPGDASADLDTTSTTSLQLNGGTIKDAAGNNAILTLPAPGEAGSLGANAALVIDGVVPVVGTEGVELSVSPTPGGFDGAGIGASVFVMVWLSEAVTVNTSAGTPTLALETGGVDRAATYSYSSGRRLIFQYTVQNGDSSIDLDYNAITALQLNGATIRDAVGNSADLTLPAPGAPGSPGGRPVPVIVDGVAPQVALNGSRTPAFASSASSFSLTDVGDGSSPAFADIDADGDLDAFVGNSVGNTVFFRNTGTPSSPAFVASSSLFGFPDVGSNARPTLVDIDADGDLDAFIGTNNGSTLFFRNTGTSGSAAFASSSISFGLPDVGATAFPAFTDIDADGDLDAFIGNSSGSVLFFRNTGTRTSASFAASSIAFGLPAVGLSAYPTFADIDADGDLDAFVGNSSGNTFFFRNTGTRANAAFAGSSLAFGLPKVAAHAVPRLADIDADGDLDAFIGETAGTTLFFRNTGSGGLSSTTTAGTYGIGRVITILVPFREDVVVDTTGGLPTLLLETGSTDRTAIYSGGSFTNTLSFTYTVEAGDTSADLDIQGIGALQLNGAILSDLVGNQANLALSAPGAAGSLGANAALVIDGVAPMVTSAGLTSSNANGSYGEGSVITIQVPFNQVVTVDTSGGMPTLRLETGSTDSIATYSGGSGTDTLLFRYTVQPGDTAADLDIHSAGALQLNGASISDLANNLANLTLPAPGTAGSLAMNAALVIDALAPTLSGSSPTDGATGVSESGLIQLHFSESVQAGNGQIKLWRTDGVLIESFDGANGSGSAGGHVAFNGSSVRIVRNDFASSTGYYLTIEGNAITDLAGNAYAGIHDATTLNFTTRDSVNPTITDVSSVTADDTYAPGDAITLAVRFSEAVNAVLTGGRPSLLLETGISDRPATYLSGSGTDTLLFVYTVGSGDSAMDLAYSTTDALRLNGGSIGDVAGNLADLTLPVPDTAGSLSFHSSLVIDGIAPAVARYGSTNTAFVAASISFATPAPVLEAASPTLADIDGDGDLDAFIGELFGNTLFFRNTGSETSPAFAGSSIGFGFADVGDFAKPSFADIDTDGDLDAFVGELSGNTLFFRNTGTRTSPAFASSSIGFGLPNVGYSASPTFADSDADGDLDAFIGDRQGRILFFRNSGTPTSPAFASSSSGGGLPVVTGNAIPSLADIDGDGDLDLFAGRVEGDTLVFRNTGTSASPAFAGPSIAIDLPYGNTHASPSLADIDGDGDLDALIGTFQGNLHVFRNTGTVGLFSPNANDTYHLGSVITIQVPFTEDVFVETPLGTSPFLLLETGNTDGVAFYSGGSGTNTLSFQYVVASGHSSADLDLTSTTALQLNGGRIRDAKDNDATLHLPEPGTLGSLGASASLVIDGVVPTVSSLSSTTTNGRQGLGKMITVQVRFSEVVTVQTGNAPPTLQLETGSTDRLATYSGGSGTQTLTFSYTVGTGDVSADLDATSSLALQLNGGSIGDLAGNIANLSLPAPGAAGSLGANAALVVDGVVPTVSAAGLNASPASGGRGVGKAITIQVPFTEAVTVTGTPTLLLETGTTDRPATYISGSGTNTLSFRYTVQPGDSSADLEVTSSTALQVNGGAISDAAGNVANLTLPMPGTAGSLGANAALVIDGLAPTVAAAGPTSPTPNGTYGVGKLITIQVPFTEGVVVNTAGGKPTLSLRTGSVNQTAIYSGGSGTNTLSFQYTVQPGDISADLDVASTTALQLNGATIRDALDNDATLTLKTPGSAGSLAANAALVIDGVGPAVASNGARNPAFAGSSTAFGLPNVGIIPRPSFADIDADGDLDAFIQSNAGTIFFFRNTGTPANAAFMGSSNGFGLTVANIVPGFSLADIDSDGDLDAFLTNEDRNFLFLRNSGTATSPAFTTPSIAFGLSGVVLSIQPTFADIDADGDLDAVIGSEDGNTYVFRNTGTPVSPAFAMPSIAFGLPDVGFFASPAFVDIDADTDLDAFIGNFHGNTLFFRNTATPASGAFTGSSIGFGLPNVGWNAQPSFADIDADGDLDAFIGESSGNTLFFRNTGTGSLYSTNPNGSHAVGTVITILVPFNEIVFVNTTGGLPTLLLETGNTDRAAVYTGGSGTRTLRFQYTVQPGDTSADLDLTGSSALELNGATIRDGMDNAATLSLPAAGSRGSLAAAGALVIDGVIPTVTSGGLTSATANGTYTNGRVITIRVPFTEVVFVNTNAGTPSLLLDTGNGMQSATYSGGTGTSTLSFQYTVQSGDRSADLDASSSGALQLNGATIRDAAGNNANLLLAAPGTTGSLASNAVLILDAVVPEVASVGLVSSTPDGTYGTGAVITIRVPFTESVTVNTTGGRPTLTLETGDIDQRAIYSSGSGTDTLSFQYTVQSGDSSVDLEVTSSAALELNGAIIRDSAGNAATLTLPAPGGAGSLALNADLVIDAVAPAVASGGLTATNPIGTYGIGAVITIAVPFKEIVNVDTSGGTPTLLLETGDIDSTAIYSGGSGTNTLSFRYTVQSGDSSADLDVASSMALELNGAQIHDAVGFEANLTLPAPGSVDSLSANAALVIDGVVPRVPLYSSQYPSFAGSSSGFGLPQVPHGSHPAIVDIDADGDLDLFIGSNTGQLIFFRNTGSAFSAAFAGSSVGFGFPNFATAIGPSFADIDGDSDFDAFIGDEAGDTLVFLNTGTPTLASFVASSINNGLPAVTNRARPNFADIDADGDLDAFIGEDQGNTLFFRNTGAATRPAFAGSSLAFRLSDVGSTAAPSLVDIDGDGDLDAFIGNHEGSTIFFPNIGTAASPSFAGSSIGYGLPDVGSYAHPTFADIDADGDLDGFIGNGLGHTLFFRNTGSIGLTSPNTSGTYGIGSVITIQLSFSEVVNVDTSGGTPTLLLETGSTDRLASYSGGSGSKTLRFQYTVQSGDRSADLDVISATALQLNGASIRDVADNAANLLLPSPGSAESLAARSALVIDAVAPTLSGSNPADNATAVNESANLQLHFSEDVQAGTGLIQLWRSDGVLIEVFDVANGSGSAGGSISFSGNTLTLNPSADLASFTSYYLMVANSAIQDSGGQAFAGFSDANTLNFSTGDSVAPTVRDISSSVANGTYGSGAQIFLSIRFSEVVTVNLTGGTPSLLLETGSTDRAATYITGSGSNTLSFAYTVRNTDSSGDLDVASTSALALNGGTITDVAGNMASLTVPGPGSLGSLGANADLIISASSPQSLILNASASIVNEGASLGVRVSSTNLLPGTFVFWSLSGVGITPADVTPSLLEGSLQLGNDRSAMFSSAMTLDGVREGDEQLLLTFFSDPERTGLLAGAQFTLRDLNAVGLDGATDERDLIIGTSGDDVIRGVPVGSVLNGRGSTDTLTGNGGNDTFVLGTLSSVYYNDGDSNRSGGSDLAAITDFNTGDRIQLKGAAAHYRLSNGSLGGVSGSLLQWRGTAGAGTADETIGFIQGLTPSTLSLTNASQFIYL